MKGKDDETIKKLIADLKEEIEERLERPVPFHEITGGLYIAAGEWENISAIAAACNIARDRLQALKTSSQIDSAGDET